MQRGLFGEPNNPRCENVSGDVLLSHAVARAVPSALRGLASGLGMGPGVSLSLWSPKLYGDMVRTISKETGTVPREPHSGRDTGRTPQRLCCGKASAYYYRSAGRVTTLPLPAYQPGGLAGGLTP